MKCSDKEAVAAYRRVLKLVNGYIGKNLDPETLVTWQGGLMAWREIRLHISEAIALKHPMLRRKGGS